MNELFSMALGVVRDEPRQTSLMLCCSYFKLFRMNGLVSLLLLLFEAKETLQLLFLRLCSWWTSCCIYRLDLLIMLMITDANELFHALNVNPQVNALQCVIWHWRIDVGTCVAWRLVLSELVVSFTIKSHPWDWDSQQTRLKEGMEQGNHDCCWWLVLGLQLDDLFLVIIVAINSLVFLYVLMTKVNLNVHHLVCFRGKFLRIKCFGWSCNLLIRLTATLALYSWG